MLQNENSFFDEIQPPSAPLMEEIKKAAALYVPIMAHCNRCRSDAAGMLGQEDPTFQTILKEVSMPKVVGGAPRVAIASQEGVFVNLHLGEADSLMIFEPTPEGYRLQSERATQPRGLGDARWENLASELSDVQVLLVSGVGPKPLEILRGKGLQVFECTGFIDEQLQELHKGHAPKSLRTQEDFSCGTECQGSGTGCMS